MILSSQQVQHIYKLLHRLVHFEPTTIYGILHIPNFQNTKHFWLWIPLHFTCDLFRMICEFKLSRCMESLVVLAIDIMQEGHRAKAEVQAKRGQARQQGTVKVHFKIPLCSRSILAQKST